MIWYDYYYFVLVVPAIILSLFAQAKVKSTYNKYARISNSKHITGAQAAFNVLSHYGIRDVRIECGHGKLSDHYDPRSTVIRLSPEV